MTARQEILRRVRHALLDVPPVSPEDDVPIPWTYGLPTVMEDVLAQFVERTADYQATVVRVQPDHVAGALVELASGAGVSSAVIPDGIDPQWSDALSEAAIVIHRDEPPLTRDELNGIDAVVTAAAVGVAETGTIVLDHDEDQGRRALTLVPDTHLVVVRTDQVVSDVPEAVSRLSSAVTAGRPLTWISGPSATSDIELNRVEGVHGPRTLLVVLVDVEEA